jgi:hypothetical protein
MKEVDHNSDGEINFKEFVNMMTNIAWFFSYSTSVLIFFNFSFMENIYFLLYLKLFKINPKMNIFVLI